MVLMHNSRSATLQRAISIASLSDYKLPGVVDRDKYVIGVSGGVDSSACAIILTSLFPNVPWQLVFTSTSAEAAGTEESIARLEAFTGFNVTRVADPDGLFGLIERYTTKPEKGFFLPNAKSRFCTRVLKSECMEDYLEEQREEQLQNCGDGDEPLYHNFVGLRADEPGRTGLDSSMPWLLSHFPLRDLNFVREDVYRLVQETVGIPSFYKTNSRSSCSICPFHRDSELLASLETTPQDFVIAEKYETLTELDQQRFSLFGEDWSRRCVTYPIPSEIDIRCAKDFSEAPLKRKRVNRQDGGDLFGNRMIDVYFGVEFIVEPLLCMFVKDRVGSPGTTHMALVGWSSSKSGLSNKLNHHFWMRKDSCEAWDLTPEKETGKLTPLPRRMRSVVGAEERAALYG